MTKNPIRFLVCLVVCCHVWLPLDFTAAMSIQSAPPDDVAAGEAAKRGGAQTRETIVKPASSPADMGEVFPAAEEYGVRSFPINDDGLLSYYDDDDDIENSADKRRLRASKRRLRASKRRLRFHKRKLEFADQGALATRDNDIFDPYELDLRTPRLRFHNLRKRSAASADGRAENSERFHENSSSRNKRSVLSDLQDLGETAKPKRQLSISNQLSALTDLVVAAAKRELEERRRLRQRLLELGKRSDLSLSATDGAADDDRRDVISFLKSALGS